MYAVLLSLLIITLSLCFLAHSSEASGISFSASQIYEMTGTDEEDSEISSKIAEEIISVFEN